MLFWEFVGSFLLGALGALVIVWLRWVGTLPRFSSSVEIGIIEDEYKELSGFISSKVKERKDITCPEVKHSDNLRDDIWRQRTSSFLVSAILYVVLGGATALLFVGLEAKNILDPLVIGKLISAGALWSSFYSFIDVKKVDEANQSIREKFDAEATKKVSVLNSAFQEAKKRLDLANTRIDELAKKALDLQEENDRLKRSRKLKEDSVKEGET